MFRFPAWQEARRLRRLLHWVVQDEAEEETERQRGKKVTTTKKNYKEEEKQQEDGQEGHEINPQPVTAS
jgi:hypothetical protein